MKRILVLEFACLLLFVSFTVGQSAVVSGALCGLVSDHSGAVVPDAKISLISRSAGQHLQRSTNDVGSFIFPTLPVGTYVLEISAPGFQTEIVPTVDVEIGQTTTINFKMVPGGSGESITVNGESPLLRAQ